MGDVQHRQHVEPVRPAVPFGLALERDRSQVQRGSGSVSRRYQAVVVALLPLLWSMGNAGCSPSGAAAEAPMEPTEERVVLPRPAAERPDLQPAKAAVASRSSASPSYVLTFEARANPFAPPGLEATNRPTTAAATARMADMRLLGLMNDGRRSMAVIEIDGKQRIVFVGTRLAATADVRGLRILQIRDSDIVVGQSGRQRIVSLPRP